MKKVLIDSFDHYGNGIGKINNKILFVKNALPKEIIQYEIVKNNKNFLEGKIVKIINKSDMRISPICKYYNDCGGCNLMHISYDEQLHFKYNKIKNIINKYLKCNVKITDIVESDHSINYRNKVTFHTDIKTGFYKDKSNSLIHIDSCLLVNNKINNIITDLNKLNLTNIKSITCRTNGEDIMVVLHVIDKIDEKSIIDVLKSKCSSIIISNSKNFKYIYGNNYIINTVGNLKYYVTNDSFFQINDNVTYKLYNKIKESANLTGSENILDLYCGCGTIGMFLSDKCKSVLGVEINKSAIECAIKNKRLNNINNIDFICDNVDNINLKIKPDIIVLDPPRSGLNKKTIIEIMKLNSEKIIYVSCDPMTLVRDLKVLSEKYDIKEITPFDMFPNTYHVECVCALNRR